jgi:hypothetical protein
MTSAYVQEDSITRSQYLTLRATASGTEADAEPETGETVSPVPPAPAAAKTCSVCGQSIPDTRYAHARTCSDACSVAAKRARDRASAQRRASQPQSAADVVPIVAPAEQVGKSSSVQPITPAAAAVHEENVHTVLDLLAASHAVIVAVQLEVAGERWQLARA